MSKPVRPQIFVDPAHDSPQLRALIAQTRPDAQIMGRAPAWPVSPAPFRSEPTDVGDQLLIPGCEKRQDRQGMAPAQGSLFDQ